MEKLRICREQKGLTQKQVALELHVAGPTVSQWESGIKKPSSKNLQKLADLYGVSVDYLMDRRNDEALSIEGLSQVEKKLLLDFRSLNKQGKEYILQTMAMSVTIYKNDIIPHMENRA